jgi:hypothetical protein
VKVEDAKSEWLIVGHFFKSQRLIQGKKLELISLDLNLSELVLEALEKGDIDFPPGRAFMMGFYKTYASYLGISNINLLSQIQLGASGRNSAAGKTFKKTNVNYSVLQGLPFFTWLIIGCSVAFFGVWHIVNSYSYFSFGPENGLLKESELKLPPFTAVSASAAEGLDQILKAATASTAKSILEKKEQPENKALIGNTQSFSLVFKESSWIRITDIYGKIIKEGTFSLGDKISLPITFEGLLHVGNAGGVYIQYKDTDTASIGNPGQVIPNYSLNFTKLLQLYPNLDNYR